MDKLRLLYEIKSKGYKVKDFCKIVGISSSAFSKKINGKSEFTLGEIKRICNTLEIKDPMPIFFAEWVS